LKHVHLNYFNFKGADWDTSTSEKLKSLESVGLTLCDNADIFLRWLCQSKKNSLQLVCADTYVFPADVPQDIDTSRSTLVSIAFSYWVPQKPAFRTARFDYPGSQFTKKISTDLTAIERCIDHGSRDFLVTDLELPELGRRLCYSDCGPHNFFYLMPYAANLKNYDLIIKLLNHGCSPNQRMTSGKTPLSYAVKYNDLKLVALLVSRGANIHLQDCQKRTLLHVAVKRKSIECIQWLLPLLSKDEINHRDGVGQTAIYVFVSTQLSTNEGLASIETPLKEMILYGCNPLIPVLDESLPRRYRSFEEVARPNNGKTIESIVTAKEDVLVVQRIIEEFCARN